MASRKEYEMLFALNASLGSNFNTAFKSAQNEVKNLQNRIKEYNDVLRDISAYERQKTHLDALIAKKKSFSQQIAELTREYNAGKISEEAYIQSKEKLGKEIAKTDQQIVDYNGKVERSAEKLHEAGVNTEATKEATKRYADEIKNAKKQQEELEEEAVKMGEKSNDVWTGMADTIVALGIVDKLKDIASAYKDCVNIATEFGWEMANVNALADASEEEFGQLTAKAKQLGADTRYTATESAQAMGYMAMAGWKTEDMLVGMDGVIQLAAAANTDLAETSSIVTDSLNAFGLSAKDTAHFADVLAAGATNSNTTVEYMGETFRYAASSAGALGYSIEDVAVAMGLMANRGIKGSMAGTALRQTLAKLTSGATLTSDAFGEYEFSVVNADGTMKSFRETLEELRAKFSEMTAVEKIHNAQAITGTRAYNGLLAMLNASEDEYDRLSYAIDNCTGAAERMMNVKMESMQGDLYLLTSAWDALKTSIGEVNESELRNIYGDLKDITDALNDFVIANPGLVKALLTFTGIVGGAAVAVTGLVAAMKVGKLVANAFTTSFLSVQTAMGPVGLLIAGTTAAVAGLSAAIVAVNNDLVDGEHTYAELTEKAKSFNDVISDSTREYTDNADSMTASADTAHNYIAMLRDMQAEGIKTTEQQAKYNRVVELLKTTIPDLSEQLENCTDIYSVNTYELDRNTEALKRNAMAQSYNEYLQSVYAANADVLIEQRENEIRLARAQKEKAQKQAQYNELLKEYNADVEQANRKTEEHYALTGELADATGYMAKSEAEWQNALNAKSAEIDAADNAMAAYTKAIEADKAAVKEAEEEVALAEEVVKSYSEEVTDAATGILDMSDAHVDATTALNAFDSKVQEVATEISELSEAYNEAYEEAYKSISGQFDLWDKFENKGEHSSISELGKNIKDQTQFFSDYKNVLDGILDRFSDDTTVRNFLSQFASGSAEDFNTLTSLSKMSDEDIADIASNYDKLRESQALLADDVATINEDFLTEMDETAEQFKADIESMDLYNVAYSSIESTMQGLIDGAAKKTDEYKAAVDKVKEITSGMLFETHLGTTGTVQSKGYASGTNNATAGVHLVGENGPELVMFNGGEKVINAERTASMLGGNQIAVAFNIQGNASESTVDMLNRYADDFADRVLAVIENAGNDRSRRAYA